LVGALDGGSEPRPVVDAARSKMHSTLILVVTAALGYCLFFRRRVDLLTIAVGAAIAYYMPIIIGRIDFRHHESVIRPDIRSMAIVAATLLLLIVTMVIRDLFDRVGLRERSVRLGRGEVGSVLIILMALVGVAFWNTPWASLISTDKLQLMADSSSLFRALAAMAAGLLPIIVSTRRAWIPTAIAFIPAIVFLVIGFRFPLVWAACGSVLVLGAGKTRVPVLVSRRGFVLVSAGLFLFLGVMTYKHLYMSIKTGDSVKIMASIDRLLKNPDQVILISEPQSICVMVDQTITSGFKLPEGHFTDSMLSMFTPGSGWRHRNFNAQFQATFYPDRRGGMGNSPIAELWAWGGGLAVTLGVAAWSGLLLMLALISGRSQRGLSTAAVSLVGLLWAINVHRNDLRYTIILSIAVVVMWCMASLLASIWRFVSRLFVMPDCESSGADLP
jgi:hypothetical protein